MCAVDSWHVHGKAGVDDTAMLHVVRQQDVAADLQGEGDDLGRHRATL